MAIKPTAAKALAGDDGGLSDTYGKLATARKMRSAPAEPAESEEAESEEEEGDDSDGVLDKLGDASAALVLFAEEIEEVIASDKALKKLSPDVDLDKAVLDAVEASIDELPTEVVSALDHLSEAELDELVGAYDLLAEKGLTKDAGRTATYLWLAARLSQEGAEPEEEPEEAPEEEQPLEDDLDVEEV